MNGLEFINRLLRFYQREEGKISMATFVMKGPGGMEENLVRGLLIVLEPGETHRLQFDPELWTSTAPSRVFPSGVQGIMSISCMHRHQKDADALAELQDLIHPADPTDPAAVIWPLQTPRFHTDLWGYAHDQPVLVYDHGTLHARPATALVKMSVRGALCVLEC